MMESVEIRNIELLKQKYLLDIKMKEIEFSLNPENGQKYPIGKEWYLHLINNLSEEIYCDFDLDITAAEIKKKNFIKLIDSLKSTDVAKATFYNSRLKDLQVLDTLIKESRSVIANGATFNCN